MYNIINTKLLSQPQTQSANSGMPDDESSSDEDETDADVDLATEVKNDITSPETEQSTALTPRRREMARMDNQMRRAEACVVRGERALAREDRESALRHLNEALKHDPQNAHAQEILKSLGDPS